MALGKHEHTKHGGFRRERGDSLQEICGKITRNLTKSILARSSKRFAERCSTSTL